MSTKPSHQAGADQRSLFSISIWVARNASAGGFPCLIMLRKKLTIKTAVESSLTGHKLAITRGEPA